MHFELAYHNQRFVGKDARVDHDCFLWTCDVLLRRIRQLHLLKWPAVMIKKASSFFFYHVHQASHLKYFIRLS